MNRTVSSICLLASVILSGCSPRVATQLQYDRLNATVYSVSDTSALSSGSYAVPASSHPDYAMLHFYRPAGFNLANYNVSVDNVDVYTAKYDSRAEYRIDKSGHYLISAMTEKKTFLPIEVEQGRDYYIRWIHVIHGQGRHS